MRLKTLTQRAFFNPCLCAYARRPGRAVSVAASLGTALRGRACDQEFVQLDQPGAIVVDVGVNRDADGKLCGDVDFSATKERAGWITPVPGGVGPMTIGTLLANTLRATELQDSNAWS